MPQLLPFYFLNQLTFAFVILFILIFIFAKYILPTFVNLQVVRVYITKLSKLNKKYNPLFLIYFIFICFTLGFLIFYFNFQIFYTFFLIITLLVLEIFILI